jgi:branched-chain amino acid aminotransferase
MTATINVNGRITGERDAVISVLDHGFLYGEGVYEVVRAYGREPFVLDRHLRRMRVSAGMIALPMPFTDGEIRSGITDTIDAFQAQPENRNVDGLYVRFLLTRGVGDISYDPGGCLAPSLVIIIKAIAAPSAEVYERGVRVVLVSVVRNHPGSINPAIKSNNLLNNALAAQEAIRRGAFEGLMHNYRGELSEGSTTNLFIVRDGVARTPPLDAGLLSGITRGLVLELSAPTGIAVEEATLRDQDLFGADEVFITSTTREIVPVVCVDDRTIGTGMPGPVTRRLLRAYRENVQELTGYPAPAGEPRA